jgi:hypothetical protein
MRSLATASSFILSCLVNVFRIESRAIARTPESNDDVRTIFTRVETASGMSCITLSLAAARISPRQKIVALERVSTGQKCECAMAILFLFGVFVCFKCSDFLEECGDGVKEDSPVSALKNVSKTSSQTISEDVSNGWSRQRQKV